MISTDPRPQQIRPFLHPLIRDLLHGSDLPFAATRLHPGAVHLVLPQIMTENVRGLEMVLKEAGVSHRIIFAHKPTKSPALVRHAAALGLDIDVASEQELGSALAAGFVGNRIECTGPKSDSFVRVALMHGCLVSIDSLDELAEVCRSGTNPATGPRVLIRINDPRPPDRQVRHRRSKFGISLSEIGEAFDLLLRHPEVRLEGFHFHTEDQSVESKAGFLRCLISLYQESFAVGLEPRFLNIGGGFRGPELADYGEWHAFVRSIEESLMEGRSPDIWREFSYGMRVNERGRISGREKAESVFSPQPFETVIPAILDSQGDDGRSLRAMFVDCGITLLVEPGNLILNNAGISFARVVRVKRVNGDWFATLSINGLNLSRESRDFVTDPIILGDAGSGQPPVKAIDESHAARSPIGFYLGGNICAETDMIIRRMVWFPRPLVKGDILCFANTARYYSDFYDSSPHLHPQGKKFVAHRAGSGWELWCEELFGAAHYGEELGE